MTMRLRLAGVLVALLAALAGCAYEVQDVDGSTVGESLEPPRVWWQLPDGSRKLVAYEEYEGYAITEGDIILGKIDEIEASTGTDGLIEKGAIKTTSSSRWPNMIVKYGLASLGFMPQPQRGNIEAAMALWSNATGIVFQGYAGVFPTDPLTGQQIPDYIAFSASGSRCLSSVGRTGTQQGLSLGTGCVHLWQAVHELGHAIGLFHEHTRADREMYIDVYAAHATSLFADLSANDAAAAILGNYAVYGGEANGYDVPAHGRCSIPGYNFDSVMHYSSYFGELNEHWPSLIRRAESSVDGPAEYLYRCDLVGIACKWRPFREEDISNTDLGYGLFDTDAQADLFYSDGDDWFFASAGTGGWTDINTSSYVYRKARSETKLLLGDFNNDGRTDVVREASDRWYVAWSGRGGWQVLNSDSRLNGSAKAPKSLAAGDFIGDSRTDILADSNGDWYVRDGGTGNWSVYANLSEAMPNVFEVSYGDFNADNRTDIFRVNAGNWQIYVRTSATAGTWQNYSTGKAAFGPLAQNAASSSWTDSVALGDFNGDGRTDVVTTNTAGYRIWTTDPAASPPAPYNISSSYGKAVVPLHFGAFNLNFVHTCKNVGSARRCHAGSDMDGDGVTDLILSQHAPVEPPDGKPKLTKSDIYSVCVNYPQLGGPCAFGGFWTTATCPIDIW